MVNKIAATVLVLSLMALGLAQDKAQEKKEPPTVQKKADAPDPVIVARTPLPKGWSKLGLSTQQRKDIYKTRAQFAAKRQTLLDQVEKLKGEETEALNKLLTEAQRQLLAGVKK